MPVSGSISGIRWCARVGSGVCLKADTLAGIKGLIKRDREPLGTLADLKAHLNDMDKLS